MIRKKFGNSNMNHARRAKNDEFYTLNTDIEDELKHYRDKFKDKVVYCNCDDPTESEFYRYFHLNFHFFGMKKLITTHYDPDKPTYELIYQGGTCEQDDNNYNSYDEKIPLKENGDFRSEESIELLKQSDIVVTNPPFSLYQEYIKQLIDYHKKFIIIGNKNSVIGQVVFPLIMNNKLWIGINSPKEFRTPDGLTKKVSGLTRWFTNLPIKKPTDREILWNHFSQDEMPAYDNYPAFECGKVSHIPVDQEIDTWIDNNSLKGFKDFYKEDLTIKQRSTDKTLVHILRPMLGVPITFLDKYNPSSKLFPNDNMAMRFEILGESDRQNAYGLRFKKYEKGIPKYNDLNAHCVLKTGDTYKSKYARIFIRQRKDFKPTH